MTLGFRDAPLHLQFNPYIHAGYRGYLPLKKCMESIFWCNNETINIWSHILGFFLFFGLMMRDLHFLTIFEFPLKEKLIIVVLLSCFQLTMGMSVLYHTFCCHSAQLHRKLLGWDLLGITLSMTAIYTSFIYYGFICDQVWQRLHLAVTGGAVAAVLWVARPASDFSPVARARAFFAWGLYGVLLTAHWLHVMRHIRRQIVHMFLTRIVETYAMAFGCYAAYSFRFPEVLLPGRCDLVGASHQLWHVIVLALLYHCYNTGVLYVQVRVNSFCPNYPLYLLP